MRFNTNSTPSSYEGLQFRSHLETKWAYFLNFIGEEWEYEPQQYLLQSGDVYTPDFWLKDLKAFLEVKGGAYTMEDIDKAQKLAEESKTPVILSLNAPFENEMLEVIDPLKEDPIFMTWGLNEGKLTLIPYHFNQKEKETEFINYLNTVSNEQQYIQKTEKYSKNANKS